MIPASARRLLLNLLPRPLLILWVQLDLALVHCPSINRTNPEGETNKQNKQHVHWCRRDNCPLYEPPTESSLGVQIVLNSLTFIQHSLDIKNPIWKTIGLELN